MHIHFAGQSPERQQFDALAVVLEADAGKLAQVAAAELRVSDRGAVVEQLRYLANLIEAQQYPAHEMTLDTAV